MGDNAVATFVCCCCHNKIPQVGRGGLSNGNLSSHSSGGQKSQIKVSAVWVSPEASLSLPILARSFLFGKIPGAAAWFYMDTSLNGLGAHLYDLI